MNLTPKRNENHRSIAKSGSQTFRCHFSSKIQYKALIYALDNYLDVIYN